MRATAHQCPAQRAVLSLSPQLRNPPACPCHHHHHSPDCCDGLCGSGRVCGMSACGTRCGEDASERASRDDGARASRDVPAAPAHARRKLAPARKHVELCGNGSTTGLRRVPTPRASTRPTPAHVHTRRRRPRLARRAGCDGTRAAQACPCQEARGLSGNGSTTGLRSHAHRRNLVRQSETTSASTEGLHTSAR